MLSALGLQQALEEALETCAHLILDVCVLPLLDRVDSLDEALRERP